jgi:hypothetical protein
MNKWHFTFSSVGAGNFNLRRPETQGVSDLDAQLDIWIHDRGRNIKLEKQLHNFHP